MEKILLQTHDDSWEITYADEQQLLGSTLAQYSIRIHHVGSTAVPDLLAKPIIDIAIEATVFPPVGSILQQLSSIGYEYRGEAGIEGRHWFTKGIPRKFNLHYCALNSPIVKSQLAFRDSLIHSEPLRREYEQVKIENSVGKDIDDADYAIAKSPLIKKAIG